MGVCRNRLCGVIKSSGMTGVSGTTTSSANKECLRMSFVSFVSADASTAASFSFALTIKASRECVPAFGDMPMSDEPRFGRPYLPGFEHLIDSSFVRLLSRVCLRCSNSPCVCSSGMVLTNSMNIFRLCRPRLPSICHLSIIFFAADHPSN